MSSKALMFLGLLMAMVLVMSSHVTARELVEKASKSLHPSKEAEKKNVAVNDAKYYGPEDNGGGGAPGYGGFNGGGNPGGGGEYCPYGCKFAGEKVDGQPQN